MSFRRPKIPWPHSVDHEKKKVYVYCESGFPTVMMVPKKVKAAYHDYTAALETRDTAIQKGMIQE